MRRNAFWSAWSRIKTGKPPPIGEEDVRRIVREEVKRQTKVGCNNFQLRGGMFCGNCGYHYDEHK